MIIDTDDETRRAVRIKAARSNKSPSDLVNDLIRRAFAKEVEEAKQAIAEERGESVSRKRHN